MHVRSSLSKKFMPYVLAKKEKEMGMSFLQFLDVGQLELNKILFLIQIGNSISPNPQKFMTEEEAGTVLQQYLDQRDSEGNQTKSVITAFIDLIGDMDLDLGFLREVGMSTEQMYQNIRRSTSDKLSESIDTATLGDEPEQLTLY